MIIIFSVGVEEFGSENTVLETLIHVHFVNTAVRRIFLIMGGDADACRPVSQNDIGTVTAAAPIISLLPLLRRPQTSAVFSSGVSF